MGRGKRKRRSTQRKSKPAPPEEPVLPDPEPPPPKKELPIAVWIAALIILSIIPFTPAINNQFIDWDDPQYVSRNPDIQSLSMDSIKKLFSKSYVSMYCPITMLSYSIDYSLFGMDATAFHMTNLLYHLGTVLFLFLILRTFFPGNFEAWLGAMLFSIHPLRMESVAWISERKDVLCGFFFFLSLWMMIRFSRGGKKRHYAIAIISFILAIFSKAMAMSLPVILFILFWLEQSLSKKWILQLIPFFALSFLIGIITIQSQHTQSFGAQKEMLRFQPWVGFYGFIFYLEKTLFPFGLSLLYPTPESGGFGNPRVIVGLMAFGGGLWAAVRYRKEYPYIVFCGLFFLVTLFPVLGFIPLPGTAVAADRYTYIPSLGLSLLAVIGLHWAGKQKAQVKEITFGLGLALILFFGYRSWERAKVWEKGSLHLWLNVQKQFPECGDAYAHLGNLMGDQQAGKAVELYTQALEHGFINPGVYLNRGRILLRAKRYELAEQDFLDVIRLSPKHEDGYLAAAELYVELKNKDKYFALYQKMKEQFPKSWGADFWLGNFYLSTGDYQKAIQAYDRSIQMDPTYMMSYLNMALCLQKLNEPKKALEVCDFVIQQGPQLGKAYWVRARIFDGQGRIKEAIRDLETAMRLDPSLRRGNMSTLEKWKKQLHQ